MFVMKQHFSLYTERLDNCFCSTGVRSGNGPLRFRTLIKTGIALLLAGQVPLAVAEDISLPRLIDLAIEQDAWLQGSHYQEQAQFARGNSAYQLPDPTISLKFANLPVDTFNLDQEAMTQVVAGISQMFPPGDSRALKQQQLHQQGARQPSLRDDRKAFIRLQLSTIWLGYQQAQRSIKLLQSNLSLYDQLTDITEAGYASALVRVGQDDLIKAQLDRVQVDDRLTRLQQQADVSRAQLLLWVYNPDGDYSFAVSDAIPEIKSRYDQLLSDRVEMQRVIGATAHHPKVKAIESQIQAAETGVQIQHQQYKPQWGINASYGYRADDLNGRDRADLFSVGVTLQMPLFGSARQDSQVQAAVADVEKLRTQRQLLIRQLRSELLTAQSRKERLSQRQSLYQQQLLPKARQQVRATLSAYEVDNGSYSDVIRARIAELNIRLALIEIETEHQLQTIQMNYLLAGSWNTPVQPESTGVKQ